MDNKSSFTVHLPIETLERWLKEKGMEDNMIQEYQDVVVGNLLYNTDTGYVEFEGDIISRINS